MNNIDNSNITPRCQQLPSIEGGGGGGSVASYLSLYRSHRELIARHSAPVMNALRDEACRHLEESGFPTRKVEDYKYTDVDSLMAPDYGLNIGRLDIPVNPYDAFRCDVPNMSTSLYFVVNDTFYSRALPKVGLPEGVILGSLKELSAKYSELVAKHYGQIAHTENDAVTALNTMLAQDGLLLYVPKDVVVEKPIQLVNILRADVNFMVNRRVLIILEDNASVRLLMCDHTADEVDFLATQVIEASVGRGASLELYELEESTSRTHRLSNLYVHQEGDSRVLINGLTLIGGTTRNTTRVTLHGRGAHVDLCGMAIADGQQHVDNHTFIDHAVSDCTSHELYKYVLDDEAIGAFAGKVLVREGAQHTDSQQTNRNLCLTRSARMYTQPQLEIYADDVKCSHGATVGQLQEDALFYMQQRGISYEEARQLLMRAFVGEVIDRVGLEALRDRLHHLAEKRFRGELGKCGDCTACK